MARKELLAARDAGILLSTAVIVEPSAIALFVLWVYSVESEFSVDAGLLLAPSSELLLEPDCS